MAKKAWTWRSLLSGPFRRRDWIVLAMAVVAVTGAVIAYRGARAEQDTAIQMQRLAQGQVLELAVRQEAVTITNTKASLGMHESALERAGGEFLQDAIAANTRHATEDSAWLQMRAQEEFAAARADLTFLNALPDYGANYLPPPQPIFKRLSAEQILQATTASALADQGYETIWHDPRSSSPPEACERAGDAEAQELGSAASSIWCRLDQRIEGLHVRERHLAIAVACLVFALFWFTAADSCSGSRWLAWTFLGIGLAIATITLIIVCKEVDHEAWRWVLAAAIATPLCLAVAWVGIGWWMGPDASEGDTHSESFAVEKGSMRGPPLAHEQHLFSRITVVGMALALVISAWFGYGYTVADTNANAAAGQARFYATEVFTRSHAFAFATGQNVPLFASLYEARARLAAARQRIAAFHRPDDQAHADHLQQQSSPQERLLDDPKYGAEADISFPRRLLWHHLQVERNFVDAYNPWQPSAGLELTSARSLFWRHAASLFLVTLTLFAIGLYLLGQALAMGHGRNAYVLVFTGGLFVLGGLALGYRAIGSSLHGHPTSDDTALATDNCADLKPVVGAKDHRPETLLLAARYYAIGKVTFEHAADDSDVDESVHTLRCAVSLLPELAGAQRLLAEAIILQGSSDLGEPLVSRPQRAGIANVVELQKQARDALCEQASCKKSERSVKDPDYGGRAPGLESNLAFDNLLLGLVRNAQDKAGVAESIRNAQLAVDSAQAIGAAIEPDRLSEYYFNLGLTQLAAEHLDEARADYTQGLTSKNDIEPVVRASAMSDLENLSAFRCGLTKADHDAAAQCAQRIGIDEMKSLLARGDAAKPSKPEAPLPQADFKVEATAGHLIARIHGVDPKARLWLTWYEFDEHWNSWRTLQRLSGSVWNRPGVELVDVRSAIREYRTLRSCLAKDRYRAELYADGVRVGTQDAWQVAPRMKLIGVRDVNLRLCVPENWSLAPEAGDLRTQSSDYGRVRKFVSREGASQTPAAFLITEYMPIKVDAKHACLSPDAMSACLIKELVGKSLAGAGEAVVSFESLDPRKPAPAGALVYRAWRSEEGEGHLLVVRADALSSLQLWQVLESAEVAYDELGSVFSARCALTPRTLCATTIPARD